MEFYGNNKQNASYKISKIKIAIKKTDYPKNELNFI